MAPNARRAGRRRPIALRAVVALAAVGRALAVTCYCNAAACTPSTLTTSTGVGGTTCTLVSGTSANGDLSLRYAPTGVTVTSFTLGPGVTHWNGNIENDHSKTYTLDLTGLTHLNGTLNGYYSVPSGGGLTYTVPNLLHATRIDVASNNVINFPSLTTVGIAATGVAEHSGVGPSLSVQSTATATFPALTTVAGVRCGPTSGNDDCASATTFPALTAIHGDYTGGGVNLPALVNITGRLEMGWPQTPFVWAPALTTVGGSVSLRFDSTSDPDFWPSITNVGGALEVKSYSGYAASTLSTLSVPGVSVGSIYFIIYDNSAAVSLREINFPNLTTITGLGATVSTSSPKISFWGMRDVVDVRFPALTIVNASFESSNNLMFSASSGSSSTPPAADTTPVNVHVPCISAMQYWYTTQMLYEGKTVCPAGCNLCTSSGGGGGGPSPAPAPPPATPVTSASLNAAVTACFNEDATGNCQCSGSSCGALSGPISGWSFTGTNLNMDSLFEGRTTFNQPIGSWDVSGATSMSKMFKNASSFNQPIGSWNTGSVTNMTQMFAGASTFARDISGWDVDQVTSHDAMFDGAEAFNAKYTCDGPKCSGDSILDKLSDAQIAGIAVGCIAFVTILIVVVCVRRRRRANDKLRARLGIAPGGAPAPPPPQIIIVQQ